MIRALKRIEQKSLDEQTLIALYSLFFQEGWCDSQGTLEQVRVKLQKRQEGAIKRERAIAYAYSQQADGAAKCNVGIIDTLIVILYRYLCILI